MANSDTIKGYVGGTLRNQVKPLTLTSTVETAFSLATDTTATSVVAALVPPVNNNVAGTLVGSGSPVEFNQNAAISSQSFGRKVGVGTEAPFFSPATFDGGRPFKIRFSGTYTLNAGAANTAGINLYLGTSATLGSDTQIATLTAGGTPSTSGQFYLEALILWDSTTGKISGTFKGSIGNTFTAEAALSASATAATSAALSFIPSGVYGNAGGGTLTVAEYAIDQV